MYRLTAVTLIVQGCHMGSRVLASLLAIELGANPLTVGTLIAIYSLFPLLLAVPSGRISDRLGPRRPMLAGTAVLGAGLLLPALAPGLAALYASCALVGIGFVFFNVSIQNLVGGLGPPERRTRNFSIQALGYAGGHFAGPVLAGYAIEYAGFSWGYLVFCALLAGPLALLALDARLDLAPQPSAAGSKGALELLRLAPLRRAVLVSGLMTTGWDLYTFYVPIYGRSIGLAPSTIGNILGAFAIASVLVRIALPAATERLGSERVLVGALVVAAALFVAFPLVERAPLLFALAFGVGLTLGCGQPLTLALTYSAAPPGRAGEVTGLRLTVNNVTHIGVPLAAGALGTALGVAAVFWTSAAILVATGALVRRGVSPLSPPAP